jgi:hypothetical protein
MGLLHEQVVPTFAGVTEENHKILSQDSWRHDENSNQASPE